MDGEHYMSPTEALAWIAEVFEEDLDCLNPETERKDIIGWDSMGVLALMAGLDNDFDILVSADDMQAMTKIQDILNVLEKNGKLD